MKIILSTLGMLLLSMNSVAAEIVPLSQRSTFQIPNQSEYANFGDLRNKRRLALGTGYQGIAKDFSLITEIHLFETQSIRMNINPMLNNLFISAGLKSWINDETFSPYWTVEAWNLNNRNSSNSNLNGISGSLGIQFNKIDGASAGSSLFFEVTGLTDFKKFKLSSAASGGFIYNF